MAASAALALSAMSSGASAQYGNEEYCSHVAWVVCSWGENGHRIEPTLDCWQAEFDGCMNGYFTLSAKKPDSVAKRGDVQLASRSAAARLP